MAAAVEDPSSEPQEHPHLLLKVRPAVARAGSRVRFRFRATAVVGGRRVPVEGARIRFAKKVAYTDGNGVADVIQRFNKANRYRPNVRKAGFVAGRTGVRVLRRRRT